MAEGAEMIKSASHLLRLGGFLTVIPQNFERKSALFALACSRVLVINMRGESSRLIQRREYGTSENRFFEEHLSLYGSLDKLYVGFVRLLVPELMVNVPAYINRQR